MKINKLYILLLMMGLIFNSCSSAIDGAKYVGEVPNLSLKDYFSGDLKAWGIVQDRDGNIIKRFEVTMNGSWNGPDGVLDEDFIYSDGKKQKRIWKLKDLGNGEFEGVADDILDKATGKSHGNAFYWSYYMDLPVDDTTYRIRFDDWMWLMNDGVLINRSYMRKWGFVVGEITIVMQKR
jgi:hypothetical protein